MNEPMGVCNLCSWPTDEGISQGLGSGGDL